MTQFTLAIDTTNAAFEDRAEVPRILRDVARRIETGAIGGNILDANGTRVGEWSTFSQAYAG